MANLKTDIPFNKDFATAHQLKAALTALEQMFHSVERTDKDDSDQTPMERDAALGAQLRSWHASFVRDYPAVGK